ncbi:hypothetical protein NN561_004243 [Cricetulus griseus]
MAGTVCTMKGFMALAIIWTMAAHAETDKPLREPAKTGFQTCKDALKLPVLEVLPGGGWDNLRNVDMGRVMDLTYTNCKTTEDGQYIIPDEVFTIPQKESNLDMNSEILDSWVNYQSTTSFSINTELSLFSKVNGKFSTEFQRMKTLQVKDQAVTTRVQVRNLVYTVKNSPTSELSLGFTKALMDICDQLEKNQTKMATYLAELLVLNYGTHVVTSVDAGAALVQEDHIRSSFLLDNQNSQNTVTASAGIAFLNIVNFKLEADYTSQNALTKSYLSNRTNSRVQSMGGVPFYPGITLETWQKGISNHLVAIDREGLPLHFFIKPDKLPGLPGPLVKNTFFSQVVNFLVVCAVGGTSALVVLVSYGYIIAAVMKIHSIHGRMKAFNTCASHLTTVILFYGSGLFSYLHSNTGHSQEKNKVVSMFYGAVIPMLNPIIYSLRNKEIKEALKKLMERKKQMSCLCAIVP